jgi:hypothetical protein
MRLALREHAANFVEMPDLDHRLGLRRNSDLAFDVERGTGRRYVADQAIDCPPSNASWRASGRAGGGWSVVR